MESAARAAAPAVWRVQKVIKTSDPIQPRVITAPTAATPTNFPVINSSGVTEESNTSKIRLDRSSISELSSIWEMLNTAIHSKYTNALGAHCLSKSAIPTCSSPSALRGLKLINCACEPSTWAMVDGSIPNRVYSRLRKFLERASTMRSCN